MNKSDQTMHIKMQQGLLLSRSMLKSIKMLELAYPQFIETIKKEIEDNPLIEIERWNDEVTSEFTSSTNKTSQQLEKSTHDVLSETVTSKEKLFDVLKNQLKLVYAKDDARYEMGLIIISSIDKDGMLSLEKRKEICQEIKCDQKLLEEVIKKIQTFHPTGIASSSIKECLLMQLEEMEVEKKISLKLEKRILEEYFEELKKNKIEQLAAKLSVEKEIFQESIKKISYLNPKPAAQYASFEAQNAIAEVIVKRVDENHKGEQKLKVLVRENIFPKININKNIIKTIEKGKKSINDFEKYIREHKKKAEITINNIEYRKSNLRKIVEKLIENQKEFFFKGIFFLKPYTITQLSKEIGLDISSVSRLVNNKFIQTPQGLFSLRIFFKIATIEHKKKMGNTTVKEQVSAEHMKRLIKKIIDEAGEQSISDQRLCDILQRQGYKIARRTVNKYRRAII